MINHPHTTTILILFGLTGCPPKGDTADPADSDSETDTDTDTGGGPEVIDLSTADAKIVGEAEGDSIGDDLASGDVDGDGYDDVLIGTGMGVSVFHGPVAGLLSVTDAELRLTISTGAWSVAAGDVAGDAVGDVVIGSLGLDGAEPNCGGAYLFEGPAFGAYDETMSDAILYGEHTSDDAGASVVAGDMDGDGQGDILLGARYNDAAGHDAGAAYVVRGPVAGELNLSDAEAKLVGELENDAAGQSVCVGDVDGDGVGDALVGAPHSVLEHQGGAAYVVLGPPSGSIDLADADGKIVAPPVYNIAERLASGDVDGDGVDDILVSTLNAAYLFLGPVSGTVELSEAHAYLYANPGQEFGRWVAIGSIDGDAFADLLIRDADDYEGGGSAGAAWVVHGPVMGAFDFAAAPPSDATLLVGENADDDAGAGVGCGDVDGDSLDDVLLGAPGESHVGDESGAVYLVAGSRL